MNTIDHHPTHLNRVVVHIEKVEIFMLVVIEEMEI